MWYDPPSGEDVDKQLRHSYGHLYGPLLYILQDDTPSPIVRHSTQLDAEGEAPTWVRFEETSLWDFDNVPSWRR